MLLICPLCHLTLVKAGGVLRCANSHSFDIARQGYVNLLLEKPGKQVGDAPEMLQARARFLAGAYYQPLSDQVNRLVHDYLVMHGGHEAPDSAKCVLDVGCGEGYYIDRLKRFLDGNPGQAHRPVYGIDVSKEAIRMATSRNRSICFAVMDITKNVLLEDDSVRVLINSFAPRNPAEFTRLVTDDGLLLVIMPGSAHLLELRAAFNLLGLEKDKPQKVTDQFAGGFELVESQTLRYEMSLGNDNIVDLVNMTPSYRHISPGTRKAMMQQGNLRVTTEFVMLAFARRKN